MFGRSIWPNHLAKKGRITAERGNRIERRRERMSGTNFIVMVIMILILLFVLMNIGPLVAF